MSDNPFAVSDTVRSGFSGQVDPNEDILKGRLIGLLLETRPWVRLIGVLTMIAAVLMVIGGAVMLLGGMAGARGGFGMVGVLYLGMSVFYIYPALCLNRYASAITAVESSRGSEDLVEAVLQQKKFWRFCGIIVAVILAIYALIFVFGIIAAIAG